MAAARTLDLRPGLLAVLVLAPVIAGLTRPAALALALAAGMAIAALRGPGWRVMLHRLLHLEGFLIALLLVLPLTTPGRALVAFGPVALSGAGLELALRIALRVTAVALLVLGCLWRAGPDGLGRALHALGAPARLVWLLDLTLRHLDTARAGFRRQSEAMRARGFIPAASRHCWRSYGHLAGGALVRALARARRIDEAMRLRGGGAPRHRPLPPLSAAARVQVAASVALAAALLLVEHGA